MTLFLVVIYGFLFFLLFCLWRLQRHIEQHELSEKNSEN